VNNQQPTLVDLGVTDPVGPLWVGFDVGGTSVKIGVVDDQGRPLVKTSIPSHAENSPAATIPAMVEVASQLLSHLGKTWDDVPRVGLGTPGTMDIPRGMMLDPPNMPGWHFYPVRDHLSRECQKPVSFANDANAAAFGEYWVGSGREYPSIVLLTLGTGVGGGIIVHGLSIDGENSCGSECGHIIIDHQPTARLCGCGQRGHLEAYASATAVVKRCEEALAAGRESSIRSRIAAGDKLTAKLIGEEAAGEDALALEIVLDTAYFLGVGIVSLMHTIDPGAVILGGAMNFGGQAEPLGRRFLERIRAEVRARAFPVLAAKTTIDFARLGGDAGFIGAAGIAREAAQASSKSSQPVAGSNPNPTN
jgi:glucokinase